MSDAVAAIYAQLPPLHCKGLCAEFCGPVPMSDAEAARLREARPDLSWVDGGVNIPKPVHGGTCPLLVDGKCSSYEHRPLICRLFGAVKRLRCPHGCEPAWWMSDARASALMHEMERLTA